MKHASMVFSLIVVAINIGFAIADSNVSAAMGWGCCILYVIYPLFKEDEENTSNPL